ncbi:MAG TPA: DUF4136 domain-containing protein [Gemmatimonadaceae bacterium]|nr:DUF4136 domain-containing protein [Gemmatimonadaceae bacterium]HUL49634.1 DUF4136 domain-containing protein [Gemmatimonadales bacterium]
MKRLFPVLTAALAFACGGPSITVNRNSDVPVPKNPTWAWGRRDTVSKYELDPLAESPEVHNMVQVAIEQNLAKRGWTKVDQPANAQIIVTYHIGVRRSVEYQTTTTGVSGGWYGGYGWGYYGAPTYMSSTTTPVNYNEGALLVVLRVAPSYQVAWDGLYKKELQKMHPAQKDVQAAVDYLLNDL